MCWWRPVREPPARALLDAALASSAMDTGVSAPDGNKRRPRAYLVTRQDPNTRVARIKPDTRLVEWMSAESPWEACPALLDAYYRDGDDVWGVVDEQEAQEVVDAMGYAAALDEAFTVVTRPEPGTFLSGDGVAEEIQIAANMEASRGMRAWLMADGLAAEIIMMSHRSLDETIPAPGLSELRAELEQQAIRVHRSAERCADVARLCEPGDSAGQERTERSKYELDEAVRQIRRLAGEIAQLGFGVTANAESDTRNDRVDRGCVAVLFPPDRYSPLGGHHVVARPLSDESIAAGRVDLCGMLCRLMCERRAMVRVERASVQITFAVDGDDTLFAHAHLADHDGYEVRLAELGWRRHGHGYDAAWPSPVKIRTPAGLALATLEIVPTVDRQVQSTCVWPN